MALNKYDPDATDDGTASAAPTKSFRDGIERIIAQRDELLAALKSARQALAAASLRDPVFTDDYEAANVLIARMEEGK